MATSKLVRLLTMAFVAAGCALAVASADARPTTFNHRLTIADTTPGLNDFFGFSVGLGDVNGDGVPDIIAPRTNDAYVFSGSDGSVLLHLTLSDPNADLFFSSVAFGDLDGDGQNEIIIGAGLSDNFNGKVYIFSGATGALEATLQSPQSAPSSEFGQSVAFLQAPDGALDLLVGDPTATEDGLANAGAVYVFSGRTRALERTITAPEPKEREAFGFNVRTDAASDLAVAALEGTVNDGPGEIFLYDGRGQFEGVIANPHPDRFHVMGATALDIVAIPGREPLVAAGSFDKSTQQGEVNVFDGTHLVRTLSSPIPQTQSDFGLAVAFVNDAARKHARLLVGAPLETNANGGVGRVYEFDWRGRLMDSIDAPNAGDLAFGFPLVLDGTACTPTIAIGASGEGTNGHVEVFDSPGLSPRGGGCKRAPKPKP